MSQAAVAAETPADAVAPKGSKKKLIIIALAVVLVGGAAGAYFMLKGGKDDAKTAKHEAAPKLPALYYAMEPPFVVNFPNGGQARFLQLAVQVMTRDPKVAEQLKANDPAIRNDLLLLYGVQTVDGLGSLEGKEKLRRDTLDAVRKIIVAEGGKAEAVENVYFTSFVMQ
jgi:flagellar protein FliL